MTELGVMLCQECRLPLEYLGMRTNEQGGIVWYWKCPNQHFWRQETLGWSPISSGDVPVQDPIQLETEAE